MKSATALFCFLVAINLIPLFCQTAKLCTREDAIQAESEASSLTNWADVDRSYGRFAQCDDGAIAEGYSNTVAHLLSDDWASFDQLNSLVARHAAFGRFVLHHIDEL